jgi:hypothetical protein
MAVLAPAPPTEAGVAPGSKCAGGPGCSTLPPPPGVYTGSDKAGLVRFTLSLQPAKGRHGSAALVIRRFLFANECADVTRVTHAIPVAPHFRFTSKRAGITIRGSFVRVFTGDLFEKPFGVGKGTARIRTAGCDSGTLSFQVESR